MPSEGWYALNFNEDSNVKLTDDTLLEFFTKSQQYKNANIANFILAVPLEVN